MYISNLCFKIHDFFKKSVHGSIILKVKMQLTYLD
jgi:hypothetical protein